MVVTKLPYFDVHLAGLSLTTTSVPTWPPSRFMPRGRTVRIGSVDSGQSIVRATTTARLLLFHRIREQPSARCKGTSPRPMAINKPLTAWRIMCRFIAQFLSWLNRFDDLERQKVAWSRE